MTLREFWNPYAGAVSISFDDGRPCQLEKAIPMMDRFGIKGTFYICPTDHEGERDLRPWAEVAKSGHEIGNHTYQHKCSDNFTGLLGGLEEMTLDQIEDDVLTAQRVMEKAVPHQKKWTFCYPCFQTYVGRGTSLRSYVPVIAKHFLCGRRWGEFGFGNHPFVVDLAHVWATPTERMTAAEMIGLVEMVAARGRWLIFAFHELNGSRLTVGDYEFERLLKHLKRREKDIWTAPVVDVADKIAALQATGLSSEKSDEDTHDVVEW